MNCKDQEQVGVLRRYLLDRADRARSRLMREQIRRWVEWIDAVQKGERDQPKCNKEEIRLRAA